MDSTPSANPDLTGLPQQGELLLGKYRVERVLGVGGMGAVVEARHIQLDDRVAIKFLLAAMAQNEEVVARFLREGRAAAKIRGEHVVRVFDVGTLENGAPYMIMEFLEGQDLAQTLETTGALPLQTAVDWVLEACEAIAEAHAAGIVHRDLKPANLFVTTRSDGTACIKVLDFGISKVSSGSKSDSFSMTKTSAVMGSPRYMSPEQMRSSRNVDARSDVWALGTVLYEALAGVAAFDSETMPELCARILTEPPAPLASHRADLPDGFEEALMLSLEKDPAVRYQDVAQFAAALAPFGSAQAAASAQRAARVLKVSGSPASRSVVGSDPMVASAASAPSRVSRLPPVPRSTPPRASHPHAQTHDAALLSGSNIAVAKSHGIAWVMGASVAVIALVGLGAGGMWWVSHRAASVSPSAAPATMTVVPQATAASVVESAVALQGLPPATSAPSAAVDAGVATAASAPVLASGKAGGAQLSRASGRGPGAPRPVVQAPTPPQSPQPQKVANPFEDR
jgi:serine/threonine-protein kinase